ncbi:uncharacterized protein LOC124162706 isoform X2 [Ischnura elegans]|uniref:uncharacterized protein LOC124162706 isoform X2 n=1 Tax=Ischnura elegans TaxID=197161 RepID=UPI001ED8BE73|nr:uncharacterized protein LOC124162706 isoform X2 [Ischnura elegans]
MDNPKLDKAELFDAVRRRRWRGHSQEREGDGEGVRGAGASAGRSSDEEEDLGLPRSPCNSPSSGEAGLRSDQKEIQSKSHSTCSEGSLLSMGSSDMDEDSQGHFSGHSSKLSLQEKSSSQYDLELDLGATAEPLSHSAARHKMAVRPKRTHGAPRLRRLKEVTSLGSLPTTPEVNEDSGRCSSPETSFNQETSSNEQIQVPSDIPLHKHMSTSSSTTEMLSRGSHTQNQSSSSGKLNASPLHESASLLPKSSHHSTSETLHSVSKPINVRPLEVSADNSHEQRNGTHGSPTKSISDSKDWVNRENGTEAEEIFIEDSHTQRHDVTSGSLPKNASDSREWVEKDGGGIEDVSGIEESESGGTKLLSRILSWRGSKKKVDESPEGPTSPVEGPSRRMDVHGRYVHEVICETEVFTGAANPTPPSPGWRPAPFSTSWPPLVHSTPRSTSSRQISAEMEEQGKDDSEDAMWASVEFSGPRSLPLVLQEDMVDSGHERGTMEKSHHQFTQGSESFTTKPKPPRPFSSHGEAPVEVMLSKSSSLKTQRLDQNTILTSKDAPESLPVMLERSEFDHSHVLPSESFLVDKSRSHGVMEIDTSPKETLLKSSAEGLLTLDVNGAMSETRSREVVYDDRNDFSVTHEEANTKNVDTWRERQREVDAELDTIMCPPIPPMAQPMDTFETSVILRHARMEQPEEDSQLRHGKTVDNIPQVEQIPDVPMQEQMDPTQPFEEEVSSSAPTPSAASRYKRVQSLPNDASVAKSSDVPEFLRVQLNHVDSRPATNVVLHSTGGVPTPVNQPELSNTPVRRRMRPHSADGLETNQTEDLSSPVISRGGTGGSFNSDKQIGYRSRTSSRDSIEMAPPVEIVRPKESSLPRSGIFKRDIVADKAENSEGFTVKMDDGSGPLRKSPSRDVLIVAQSESGIMPMKDAPGLSKITRKSTEDLSSKGLGNIVTPMKDKEEVRPNRPMSVRESLGVITAQNDANKPKDASLPPKAVRKVSGDDSSSEVVPRRKSTSAKDFGAKKTEDEPELFKVFARRSLKLKDSETWESHPPPQNQQRSRDSDKENDSGDNAIDVVILPMSKEQKQRDSLIKGEFLKDLEHPVKSTPTHTAETSHHLRPLQRIPSSNGIVPPCPLNGGSVELRSNSLYSNSEKNTSEGPKIHRSSVTGGSLPRREGPSPEKRPRGSSINLPPESQPVRVEINRVGIPFDPRRPSWASQIQSEGISDAFGKPSSSEITEVCRQPIDLGMDGEEDSKPHFKRIQQRKEEWELRARMQ